MAKTKSNSTQAKKKPAKAAASSATKNKNSKASTKPQPSNKAGGTIAAAGPKKNVIFKYVCEEHLMGIKEVAKMDVALAAGFKNIRSEGFSKPLKELIDEGLLEKGSQKDLVCLTQKGADNMPDDLDQNPDPTAVNDRFIAFLEKKVKNGADKKIRPIWEILSDGQAHAVNDISNELGYKNPRSFSNTKIISSMKEMGLVEPVGKGSVKFTNKVRL